jgi:hypothetical protein
MEEIAGEGGRDRSDMANSHRIGKLKSARPHSSSSCCRHCDHSRRNSPRVGKMAGARKLASWGKLARFHLASGINSIHPTNNETLSSLSKRITSEAPELVSGCTTMPLAARNTSLVTSEAPCHHFFAQESRRGIHRSSAGALHLSSTYQSRFPHVRHSRPPAHTFPRCGDAEARGTLLPNR